MSQDDNTARILAHARESATKAGAWIAAIDRDAFPIDPNDAHGLLVTLHSCQRGLEWTANEIERLKALHADIARLLEEGTELFRKREAEIERLKSEVEASRVWSAEQLAGLKAILRSERLSPPMPCVDHPILDKITTTLTADDAWSPWAVERMGECLEFRDVGGRRYEIVVRPIDGDEDEEPTCAPPAGP